MLCSTLTLVPALVTLVPFPVDIASCCGNLGKTRRTYSTAAVVTCTILWRLSRAFESLILRNLFSTPLHLGPWMILAHRICGSASKNLLWKSFLTSSRTGGLNCLSFKILAPRALPSTTHRLQPCSWEPSSSENLLFLSFATLPLVLLEHIHEITYFKWYLYIEMCVTTCICM